MLNFINGKDAIWETDKYDAILVGTSIYCMLTNGFQSKMRLKYPYIETANNSTNYGDKRKLGKRLTISGKPMISLLYIAKHPHSKREFLDYDALENALATANAEFRGKKVLTTVLGCSRFDGNGDRDKVIPMMDRLLKDTNVDVYDYLQIPKRDEIRLYFNKIKSFEKNDEAKYNKLWPIRKKLIGDLYLEF